MKHISEIMQYNQSFPNLLMKGFKIEIKAAVGVVFANIEGTLCYLLCKSTADDDRKDMLCFPGGGVEVGESPLQAAVREVYEETGISVRPINVIGLQHPTKPFVMFYPLLATNNDKIKLNEEFSKYMWVNVNEELPTDMMGVNKDIIKTLLNLRNETI